MAFGQTAWRFKRMRMPTTLGLSLALLVAPPAAMAKQHDSAQHHAAPSIKAKSAPPSRTRSAKKASAAKRVSARGERAIQRSRSHMHYEEVSLPAEATGSIMTSAIPLSIISIAAAARGDISISSDGLTGPRSLIRTITERPFRRFVTRTSEFSGSERCAAVA